MTDRDRRRVLALGGAALLTGLAGCLFEDTTGVPGRDGEPEAESAETGTFGPRE